MGKYKALLLDADDTLLDFQANERESVKKVFQKLGLSADDSVLAQYSAINRELWLAHERGEITKQMIWDQRFVRLFKALNCRADGLEAERLYRVALGEGAQTIPGAVELCQELSGAYELYIVTNGTAQTQYSRIHNAGLDRWVSGVFISEEIGVPKPAKKYFDAVFAAIPFSRQEALIVGDSLTSDIQGGVNAGVDTCWYNPQNVENKTDIAPKFTVGSYEELYRIVMEPEELENLGVRNRRHSNEALL